MKKIFFIGVLAISFANTKAQIGQVVTTTFESLTLPNNSYWNGSSNPLGTSFTDGNLIFPNYYDTAFGGYWAKGWAYSNKKDSTTAGYANIYSARPANGSYSEKYAIGQQDAVIKVKSGVYNKGWVPREIFVTNGTYPALSMKNGDAIAKKFGGTSGNDPDWFKLTIRAYRGGVMKNDSVVFYLADYRSNDSKQDYIVKDWKMITISSLGNIDSLNFILSSSDVGTYGMNTPAFFCIDNFISVDSLITAIPETDNNLSFSLFPNPTDNNINIKLSDLNSNDKISIEIIDVMGKSVYSEITHTVPSQISVASLPSGIYHLRITGNNFAENKSFIKQ